MLRQYLLTPSCFGGCGAWAVFFCHRLEFWRGVLLGSQRSEVAFSFLTAHSFWPATSANSSVHYRGLPSKDHIYSWEYLNGPQSKAVSCAKICSFVGSHWPFSSSKRSRATEPRSSSTTVLLLHKQPLDATVDALPYTSLPITHCTDEIYHFRPHHRPSRDSSFRRLSPWSLLRRGRHPQPTWPSRCAL